MPIPYHGDTDYTIDDLDTGVDDSNALDSLKDIIDKIDPDGYTVSIDELVGDKTLENGGALGDILELLRLHINDMKNKSELTSQMTGQVYSAMIQQALTSAIDFLYRSKDMQQLDKQRSLDLVKKMFDIELSKLNNDDVQTKRKLDIFNLKFLKPLEHEQMIEQIEGLHVEHNIKQYELDELLPIDKDTKEYTLNNTMPVQNALTNEQMYKTIAEKDLTDAERYIKSYYNDEMQPIEKDILNNQKKTGDIDVEIKDYYKEDMQPIEKSILDYQRDTAAKDLDAKEYYNSYMQPIEKDILEEQELVQHKDNEIKQYYIDNIQPLEKDELEEKELLANKENAVKQYYIDEMQPVEKLMLDDEHCIKSTDCAIKMYYKDNIQQKEFELTEKEVDLKTEQIALEHQKTLIAEKDLDLKIKELSLRDKEIELTGKELDLKEYEFDEMMPLRKELLNNQSLLTGKQACVQQAECDIKNYYHNDIQPYERDLAHAKAFQEEVMAGNYTIEDSMAKKKIDLMNTQQILYERQTLSYDDHKWQKLLETQTNYQSMIYADFVGVPEVLTYALNDHVKTVYSKLNPDDTIS